MSAEHILNRLVRWVKKHPQRIRYQRLRGSLRLVLVSDSAFAAGETDGLAMRGALVLLVESESDQPFGKVHVLDYYARKQPHVCRSTFAAELHAALDALNQGIVIQAALSELAYGAQSASVLADWQERGLLEPSLEMCIDARSVFDAVTAPTVQVPSDKHLHLHVLSLRDFLDNEILRRLWWIDTLDMLADGLTKGKVDRNALVEAMGGSWTPRGVPPVMWPPALPNTAQPLRGLADSQDQQFWARRHAPLHGGLHHQVPHRHALPAPLHGRDRPQFQPRAWPG